VFYPMRPSPSPEEIARECQAIQEKWTPSQRLAAFRGADVSEPGEPRKVRRKPRKPALPRFATPANQDLPQSPPQVGPSQSEVRLKLLEIQTAGCCRCRATLSTDPGSKRFAVVVLRNDVHVLMCAMCHTIVTNPKPKKRDVQP
jgi:hypothetical protein